MKILRSERRAFEDSAEAVQSSAAALETAVDQLRGNAATFNADLRSGLWALQSQATRASRAVAVASDRHAKAFEEIERTAGIVRAAAVALVLIAAAVAITKIKAANR